jgi:iron complex outermembrane receptor protein
LPAVPSVRLSFLVSSLLLTPIAVAGEVDLTAGVSEITDLDLESLLVAATKTAQTAAEAPAIVTVLTREQIQLWGYTTIAEVLTHVTGFYVVDDHILPNVGVRGISGGLRSESGTLKVMIDGTSVAFRSTGGNWLGAELVPINAIERVEILRGPASALYGADAFLGVINIVTRTGASLDGAALTLDLRLQRPALPYLGPGGGVDLAFGGSNGPLDVLVSSRVAREDRSSLPLPSTSPAPFAPPDRSVATGLDLTSGTVLARARYRLGGGSSASLTGYGSVLDRGAEFADWAQLAHGVDSAGRLTENRISLTRGFVNANVSLDVVDSLDVTVDVVAFAGGPTARDTIEVGSDIFSVRRVFGYSGYELRLGATTELLDGLTAVGGVEYVYDLEQLPSTLHILKADTDDLDAGDVRASTSTVQPNQAFINPGAYAQLHWLAIERLLTLTGGVRYDYHNIYGNQLSGRLGAVSSPIENLHFKLLYGSAFKAPSPQLLYGVPLRPGDVTGSPVLQPQYVHTVEGQVSWSYAWFRARTGVSYNYLINSAEFTLQGVNKVARNIAEVSSTSWETELEVKNDDVRGYANLAVNHVVRDTDEEGYRQSLIGNDNVGYPPVVSSVGMQGHLPFVPVRATLEVTAVSERRANEDNILENRASYAPLRYALVGGVLELDAVELLAGRATTLRLVGRNVLDTQSADPGYAGIDLPLTGRTLMLQLTQEL